MPVPDERVQALIAASRQKREAMEVSHPPTAPPKRTNINTFRRICDYCERYYKMNNGSLAPIPEIAESVGLGAARVSKIMNTTEFHLEMDRRGCRWTDNKRLLYALTPQQQMAVNILTNPTDRRTLEKKLSGIGISYSTYTAWMRQPGFARAVETISEQMLHDNIGNIHTRLVNKADAGDMQAIKLYYGLTGRYSEGQQQMLDFTRAVGLILEVLTRHVHDRDTLQRISGDIDKIMSGGVPRLDGDVPNNYVPSTVIPQPEYEEIEPRLWSPPAVPDIDDLDDLD
jgi:hypothetical protein